MATETKSGRQVRTPGKYAYCVTGKRKNKGRKLNSTNTTINSSIMNDTMDTEMTDVTTTSMMVNVLHENDASTCYEMNDDAQTTVTAECNG